jgi:galactokinase
MIEQIKQAFEEQFSASPLLFKSPGRVNLIGEHTDYNEGFVLPAAVNRYAYFAVKPNDLNEYRFIAFDYNEKFITSINQTEPSKVHWANYLLGVIAQFEKDDKKVPGFDCVFGSTIPIGAGMSSSAAIECGIAYALNQVYSLGYRKIELAKIGQKAEHEYAGVKCGIMDQFASLHGKSNHVVKLDCQTLQHEYYELNMADLSIILVNTGVKHSLASSEYNKRRNECNEGVEILRQYDSGYRSLREIDLEIMRLHELEFSPTVWNRCSYVIEENHRVICACDALQKKDFATFGKLMYKSHYGLRDKYEVSCKELDQLVDLTESMEGVLGSRMMGGGFGGCTINLVKNEFINEFKQIVSSSYKTPEGKQPEIIECVIGDGTGRVSE